MANFKNTAVTISPNTYAGQAFAEYMTPALLRPKGIVDRGLVSSLTGFKDEIAMLGADASLEMKNPSAVFSAQASGLTRDEKKLQLVKYEVQLQTDYDNLRTSWEASMEGRNGIPAGSFGDYLGTQTLSDFYLNNIIVPKLAGANEQLYLLGKDAVNYGGCTASGITAGYPGLLGQFEAGSDIEKFAIGEVATAQQAITAIATGAAGAATVTVTDGTKFAVGDKITVVGADGNQQIGGVTINGQTVTVRAIAGEVLTIREAVTGDTDATEGFVQFVNQSNVLDVLDFIYNVIPQAIKNMEGTRVFVSSKIMEAYRKANAAAGTGAGNFFREDYFGTTSVPYLNILLEQMDLWNENEVAVWHPSNVFVGADLFSDEVGVEILYLGQTTGDRVFRSINSMKSGTQFKFGNEIVYARPADIS